jgi:hypothetical protein
LPPPASTTIAPNSGALGLDVLGDVIERVPLDHQVLRDIEALGLGDLEPVVGGLADGVGVQEQRAQPEDHGVVEGDEPGRCGLAGAALEHSDVSKAFRRVCHDTPASSAA